MAVGPHARARWPRETLLPTGIRRHTRAAGGQCEGQTDVRCRRRRLRDSDMEAPPLLIEAIVRRLTPAPCREHVLGDLCERYTSPLAYVSQAVRTLPYVIV